MSTQPLLDRTLKLIEHRGDLTYVEIAEGAEVGIDWFSKFARGEIPDASVNRVQRVHDFLASRVRVSRRAVS